MRTRAQGPGEHCRFPIRRERKSRGSRVVCPREDHVPAVTAVPGGDRLVLGSPLRDPAAIAIDDEAQSVGSGDEMGLHERIRDDAPRHSTSSPRYLDVETDVGATRPKLRTRGCRTGNIAGTSRRVRLDVWAPRAERQDPPSGTQLRTSEAAGAAAAEPPVDRRVKRSSRRVPTGLPAAGEEILEHAPGHATAAPVLGDRESRPRARHRSAMPGGGLPRARGCGHGHRHAQYDDQRSNRSGPHAEHPSQGRPAEVAVEPCRSTETALRQLRLARATRTASPGRATGSRRRSTC
jgi:hypothetical protein